MSIFNDIFFKKENHLEGHPLVLSNLTVCFSQDLLTVCRELNLEDSLEELMRELGADEQGRISYQEFLRRRLALRPEIEALRGQPHTRDYLPTSSDNSLGEQSFRYLLTVCLYKFYQSPFSEEERTFLKNIHYLRRLVYYKLVLELSRGN